MILFLVFVLFLFPSLHVCVYPPDEEVGELYSSFKLTT